ncbi:sensor histidine kinase, partial [Gemmatimonadota bacterium]
MMEGTWRTRWLTFIPVTVGVWTLVGVFASANYYANIRVPETTPEWQEFFWPNLLAVWIWAAYTPLVFHLSYLLRFDRRNWPGALAAHLGLWVAFTATDVVAHNLLFPVFLDYAPKDFMDAFCSQLWYNVFNYGGTVCVAHALSYYRLFRNEAVRTIRLESKLGETRLQVLRSHLHPHFLFNTINAAAELTHHDPELADRMLTRMSQLLQRAFSESKVLLAPLEREISFVDQYLEIAKIRFGGRLQTEVSVSPEAMSALVPSFILQPLIENA